MKWHSAYWPLLTLCYCRGCLDVGDTDWRCIAGCAGLWRFFTLHDCSGNTTTEPCMQRCPQHWAIYSRRHPVGSFQHGNLQPGIWLLASLYSSLSNPVQVLFRNNFALSRDITGLFQSFQSSSVVFDPAANPTLFRSTLVIIIKVGQPFIIVLPWITQVSF